MITHQLLLFKKIYTCSSFNYFNFVKKESTWHIPVVWVISTTDCVPLELGIEFSVCSSITLGRENGKYRWYCKLKVLEDTLWSPFYFHETFHFNKLQDHFSSESKLLLLSPFAHFSCLNGWPDFEILSAIFVAVGRKQEDTGSKVKLFRSYWTLILPEQPFKIWNRLYF